MEVLLGFLFAIVAICIIAIVGADTAYKMARDDYERDIEREIADRIENANIETRVEIQWIEC